MFTSNGLKRHHSQSSRFHNVKTRIREQMKMWSGLSRHDVTRSEAALTAVAVPSPCHAQIIEVLGELSSVINSSVAPVHSR
jgi:hypothetical protein